MNTKPILLVLLFLTTFQAAIAQNIALNKPAYTSSQEDGRYPPGLSFDGHGGNGQVDAIGDCTGNCTRWSSAFNNNEWIYVDLGAIYHLSSAVIYWERSSAASFSIQVSKDTSSWTTVQTITGNSSVKKNTILLTGKDARYVRMQGITRSGIYGYSIWEFEVYAASPTPLPVGIQDFSATNQSGNVLLNWSAQTTAATTFEVERSTDGAHFTGIGSLTSDGAANKEYNYLDHNTVAGTQYYRLNATEPNGETTYSKIISMNVDKPGTAFIYPNPVVGRTIHVQPEASATSITATLTSMNGSVAGHWTQEISKGSAFTLEADAGLAPGVYLLRVLSNGEAHQFRVVLQ